MVVFPNAKINLGLHILRKRADGYHDLSTVFYPLQISDVLEIIPNTAHEGVYFTASGLPVAGNPQHNLCIKAYELLKQRFPELPYIQMHLHKIIPMGAGLGGGSADGAFVLSTLNQYFQLQLSHETLIELALQLGSDCPFFIYNQPCLGASRGEVLTPIQLDLKAYHFLIVNPGIHVNTGWAFSQILPAEPPISLAQVIQLPIEQWKAQLINDFEAPVAAAHPAIHQIKESMYQHGAVYASMSGSGSTVYGIFPKHLQPNISFPGSYFQQWI